MEEIAGEAVSATSLEKKSPKKKLTMKQIMEEIYIDRDLNNLDEIEGIWVRWVGEEKKGRLYIIIRSDDYLYEEISQLAIKMVITPSKDKLDTLLELIAHLQNQNGIIFCNFKDSIERISEYLSEYNVSHGTFYGGMEQGERERTLIKFRNGTHQILLATDLAARGIDVPEINFIIHYHLPNKSEEFTHRNGRTARMNSNGTAYVLHLEQENLPDFIGDLPVEQLTKKPLQERAEWSTLFISGGRKDKISKGDIAGLFFKQGNLSKGELGVIELKNDCAFVSVKTDTIKHLLPKVNNTRLKKKKVRITVA